VRRTALVLLAASAVAVLRLPRGGGDGWTEPGMVAWWATALEDVAAFGGPRTGRP
jgi:hypothetical protein